jgi:hypothetical protein
MKAGSFDAVGYVEGRVPGGEVNRLVLRGRASLTEIMRVMRCGCVACSSSQADFSCLIIPLCIVLLVSNAMVPYCAFLELPPELRTIIYEYVAIDEGTLLIKKRFRPKYGHIAARSGLVLANRQICGEYVGVVQEVSLWPGIELDVWVHDFNFRHLERYVSTLRRRKLFTPEHLRTFVYVHLTISACENIYTERFASWVALDHRGGLNILYDVEDAQSGHVFPAAPPMYSDMSIFRQCADYFVEAGVIYRTVKRFQRRFFDRCYRLRSPDPSKQDRFMRWISDALDIHGSYEEVPPLEPIYRQIIEVWVD